MSDSSRPSLAIIGACSAVGGLVFIFLAVRIGLRIHRRRKLRPLPLPPPRPLGARHEMSWSTNASKTNLSTPSLSPIVYQPDLLMGQRHDAHGRAENVYMQYSGSTLNTTEETPLHQPPSPVTPFSASQAPLAPPQPSFFASSGNTSDRSSAQSSVNSSTEELDIASYPPQQHQSVTAFSTEPPTEDLSLSHPDGSSGAASLSPNSSPRMNGGRTRPLSAAASVSSMQTTRSIRSTRSLSTFRGVPHSPYSRVEIVLPAPLAPQNRLCVPVPGGDSSLAREMSEGNLGLAHSSRQSVCDPWLKVGRESTGPGAVPSQSGRERARRSRTFSSEMQLAPRTRPSRPSVSSISSFTTSANSSAPYTSRSSSVSSHANSLRQEVSLDMSCLPPVPRIPSMYYTSPSPATLALSDSITGNGTLPALASDATIRNKALSSGADTEQPVPVAVEGPEPMSAEEST